MKERRFRVASPQLVAAARAYEAGRLSQASRMCHQIIRTEPENVDAINLAGAVALASGDALAALGCFDQALAFEPGFLPALNNRGAALRRLARWREARDSYAAICGLQPGNAEAFNNLGNVLQQLGRWNEALHCHERAVALRPHFADAFSNLGVALSRLGRFDEALTSFDRALTLLPDHGEALINRGAALRALGRLESALESISRIAEGNPRFAEALNDRGLVLQDLGRWEEARGCFERAITLRPNFPEAHWNLALLALARCDYERGWPLFEWRWKLQDRDVDPRTFDKPAWMGEGGLSGKTLLVHAEQGFGDTIQFARYVPLLAELRASVVLEVPDELGRLIASVAPAVEVVATGTSLPPYELHCPIGSLPLALRSLTSSIPARFPYLAVPAGVRLAWSRKLGPQRKRRIGIAWSGNPANKFDRLRSIELARVASLIDDRFEWHALQRELRPSDEDVAKSTPALRVWCRDLHDFADTAALIEALDLVISIDSAVVHLSAALGKPTWALLPSITDYRWPVGLERSPWYPDVHLFRQPSAGDWAGVVEMVRAALDRRFGP